MVYLATIKNSQYKVQVSSMGILHRESNGDWSSFLCHKSCSNLFGRVCCMCISWALLKPDGSYIYMVQWGPKLVFVSQISLIFARAQGCFKLLWRGCDIFPRNSLFPPLCVFFWQEALEECSLERVMCVSCWVFMLVPYMDCFKDGSKFSLRWQK